MSEAEKTIIFESNKRYPPGSTTNNLWFVFREGAKFGYQLGKDEVKAALRREIDREKAEALLSKNYSPKTLQTLDKVLSLLDTVEPTSESKEKPQ